MDSKTVAHSQLALSLSVRALLIGALTFLFVYLLATTHFYATALVVALVAVVIGVDLVRTIARAEWVTERFLEGLIADVVEVPVQRFAGFARLVAPFERAAAAIQATRTKQRLQVEYLQTLLDTVSAALIVMREDGEIVLANRAAQKLAIQPLGHLAEITAIGATAAGVLRSLKPGSRQIVVLADGHQMLAAVAQFSVPGRAPAQLLSLQRIAGELDAVELKAWQDMTRVLAHEMMNSLTPISSLSESLEMLFLANAKSSSAIHTNDVSNEIAEALEAIKRRSLGLMSFVERYRKIAELPAPRMQQIQMEGFLAGMVRLVSTTLRDRHIVCRTQVSPANLALQADPELLEQALINLIRNAMDAVGDVESPKLELACALSGERVVITVSDNGCGLPEHERDQIFVPFFTTKPGGSGIGLSLARHIALAHGGQLEVHVNCPQGSVFALTLPAAHVEAKPATIS